MLRDYPFDQDFIVPVLTYPEHEHQFEIRVQAEAQAKEATRQANFDRRLADLDRRVTFAEAEYGRAADLCFEHLNRFSEAAGQIISEAKESNEINGDVDDRSSDESSDSPLYSHVFDGRPC